ncbi:hypothetical protein [Streptomyces sp. NPDC046978]|uniref:hypothetical protein n=1 Tax=Streptomyces sp. NPDC046978 TaxID=3154704 RepID=UPI0034032A4B
MVIEVDPEQLHVHATIVRATLNFVTRIVADALAARSGPGPGQRHATQPGRRADAGPLPRQEAYGR